MPLNNASRKVKSLYSKRLVEFVLQKITFLIVTALLNDIPFQFVA